MTIPVRLIPYEDCDMNDVYLAVRESTAQVAPWMPWCRSDYSYDNAAAHAEVTRTGRANNTLFDFAILDSTGTFAGSCGINRIIWTEGVANIGYWVRSSMTGRGIASAAVRCLVSWAFDHTALNRLEIIAAVANTGSCRVAEKCGAKRDALLKKRVLIDGVPSNAVLFSVVRSD